MTEGGRQNSEGPGDAAEPRNKLNLKRLWPFALGDASALPGCSRSGATDYLPARGVSIAELQPRILDPTN